MSRILSLDVGRKRIGIAISDEMAILAFPYKTLDFSDAFKGIKEIINKEDIDLIIVGIPRQISGDLSNEADFVKEFVIKLKENLDKNVKIEYEDETATSVLAEERLKKRGENFRIDKGKVDMEAAAIILESYLRRRTDAET